MWSSSFLSRIISATLLPLASGRTPGRAAPPDEDADNAGLDADVLTALRPVGPAGIFRNQRNPFRAAFLHLSDLLRSGFLPAPRGPAQ